MYIHIPKKLISTTGIIISFAGSPDEISASQAFVFFQRQVPWISWNKRSLSILRTLKRLARMTGKRSKACWKIYCTLLGGVRIVSAWCFFWETNCNPAVKMLHSKMRRGSFVNICAWFHGPHRWWMSNIIVAWILQLATGFLFWPTPPLLRLGS